MTAVIEEVARDYLADELLLTAAQELKGAARRKFISRVCDQLCDGNAWQAENRFGWGRQTIKQGALEREACSDAGGGVPVVVSGNRGKQRSEVANPQLAIDIRLIVEPNSHCDPLQRRRHDSLGETGRWFAQVFRGWQGYYGVPNNGRRLQQFRNAIFHLWLRQIRRRSQKGSKWTWARMGRLMKIHLPTPRIVHPWPHVRFHDRSKGGAV